MIEHAVQNDLHSHPVGFPHEGGKEPVARFQILPVRRTDDIFRGPLIVYGAAGKHLSPVVYDQRQMRVDMFIILRIIFMV